MNYINKKLAEFDEKFPDPMEKKHGKGFALYCSFCQGKEPIKSFLKQALEEQREKILKLVKSNSKGSFTDDAGNDCWYINDLVQRIEDEISDDFEINYKKNIDITEIPEGLIAELNGIKKAVIGTKKLILQIINEKIK